MEVGERLEALEKSVSHWRLISVLEMVGVLALAGLCFLRLGSSVQAKDEIVRTRGLIIEDANGRARVLLGAPLPEASDRLRKDNGYEAMVFLDEKGNDRLSLGEMLPAQINGAVPKRRSRIAQGFGFIIDDPIGNERGGFSFLDNGRALLSLDRPNGDAWSALVDDSNGFAGTLSIYDRTVGHGATGIFSGTQGKRAFVDIKGVDDNPRGEFEVGVDQKASFRIFDATGSASANLLDGLAKP